MDSPPILSATTIVKRYGNYTAVDGLSLFARSGEVLGYLGRNGAGKTTTIRVLTGMLKPDSGTAIIDGIDVAKDPLAVKRIIGYVPESGALYDWLSANEYLHLIGRLHALPEDTLGLRVKEMLAAFGLEEKANDRMDGYSKGMRKKVAIAAALVHDPKVIFLDEPLDGLDANSAILLKALVRGLARAGKTVFYCSHMLDVVERVCDRVIVIDQGRVIAQGTVDELRSASSQSSLEGIFRELTNPGDLEGLADRLVKATSAKAPSAA